MSKFKAGQSGNPGGRPKGNARVRDLAQAQTENAIATLVSVMEDKAAPPAARVSAATAVLDRGWGKPAQPIDGDGEGGPIQIVTKDQRDAAVAAAIRADR